jgi:hypothetical protein
MTQQMEEKRNATAPRQWYVTAPHRTINRDDGEPFEVPFGIGHVRKVGAPETACGLAALNWPILWDLDLDLADAGAMCPDCKVAARRAPAGSSDVQQSCVRIPVSVSLLT